tara:strand:+ start:346 stop:546 length:201 start_codon:yes stop_codon:yes gene_type:complete
MIKFNQFNENATGLRQIMAVKSADRKPEKYVDPDGKTRIRMVPVDKEVVKSEKTFKEMRHSMGDNK